MSIHISSPSYFTVFLQTWKTGLFGGETFCILEVWAAKIDVLRRTLPGLGSFPGAGYDLSRDAQLRYSLNDGVPPQALGWLGWCVREWYISRFYTAETQKDMDWRVSRISGMPLDEFPNPQVPGLWAISWDGIPTPERQVLFQTQVPQSPFPAPIAAPRAAQSFNVQSLPGAQSFNTEARWGWMNQQKNIEKHDIVYYNIYIYVYIYIYMRVCVCVCVCMCVTCLPLQEGLAQGSKRSEKKVRRHLTSSLQSYRSSELGLESPWLCFHCFWLRTAAAHREAMVGIEFPPANNRGISSSSILPGAAANPIVRYEGASGFPSAAAYPIFWCDGTRWVLGSKIAVSKACCTPREGDGERERKPVERHCLGPGLQSLMFDGL